MTETTKSVLVTAEESLGTLLLRALVAEIQHLQSPWQNTPEEQQAAILDRLRSQVHNAVGFTVKQIASVGFKHCVAEVESLTIKEGAKATLLLARGSESLLLMAEHVNTQVLVLFADAVQYTEGMHVVRAEADQPTLPIFDATAEVPIPAPKRKYTRRAKQVVDTTTGEIA